MNHSHPLGSLIVVFVLFCLSAAQLRAADSSASTSGELPAADKLPVINQLPDPFLMNDGSRVKSKEDWARRRAELIDLILGYEYGRMPTEKTPVTSEESTSETLPNSGATVHHITLTMGPGGKVSVPLILTVPEGKGPFPIIIKGDLCWKRVAPEIVSLVISRGYMLAEFDRTAVAADNKDSRSTGILALYPQNDWGAVAAWAWGFSRVIDYAVTRHDVDPTKIIVTGHSRGGKATLLAGALDERVALTAPNGSGCGGAGCFRVQWPQSEELYAIVGHFPYWFAPHFGDFGGMVDHLPFDQHELKAIVAPRALFTTDSVDDLWANPMGTQVSFEASKIVFDFLGVGEKTGLHYRHGKHDHDLEDFAALLDFADWQLMGKPATKKFDVGPYPGLPPTHLWTAEKGK
jgi:hypothetical protein